MRFIESPPALVGENDSHTRWTSPAGAGQDGTTVYGAYGPRLFNKRGIDQFKNVLDLLGRHSSTRRAVIQLFDAEDIAAPHREIPCTCMLQFMVRDGRLELATSMRSNDAFKGLPHDIFSFTMIQEIVANILGLKLGVYTHFVGSLHLYDSNLRASKQYLEEGWQPTQFVAMSPMPPGDPRRSIEIVLEAEASIRECRDLAASVEELEPYWRDIIRLLEIYGHWTRKETAKIPRLRRAMADPVYKEYITRREPPKRSAPRSGQSNLPFIEAESEVSGEEDR
jgi:thymidylate synthase